MHKAAGSFALGRVCYLMISILAYKTSLTVSPYYIFSDAWNAVLQLFTWALRLHQIRHF